MSVVVPTFERPDTLPEVLAALDRQEGAPPFEVVVVDDGSRDATPEILARARADRYELRVERQENRGPAAARNRGVATATGDTVAFLGDDTIPEPGWLAAHEAARAARPERAPLAVIGRTEWHPRMRATRFLEHINENGLQFGYALIDDPENVPFNFFYTSNVSLPRAVLGEAPFDLRFPYPAWEDIELAYRLTRRGMAIVYEPRARVLHHHPTDFARFASRQEKAGYCGVVFQRLHPELGGFVGIGPDGPPSLPSRRAQWVREAVVHGLQYLPVSLPRVWDEALRYHYIRGLRRGWSERGGSVLEGDTP